MIRTLYLRVVITYIIIVALSLVIAFPVTMKLFTNRFISGAEEDLLSTGTQIVSLSKTLNPDDLKEFLMDLYPINKNTQFILFKENGDYMTFGAADEQGAEHIRPDQLQTVFNGIVYKNRDYDKVNDIKDVVVGMPLDHRGHRYALFLTPRYFQRSVNPQTITITVLLIVLLIGSLLILIASRYVVNPLKRLTKATRRLARGDFDVQVFVKQQDEIGELASSFNHMAGELKQLEQMRQDFISNVSHEIQSPLTSIRGFSKALRHPDMKEEHRVHYLEIIEKESERLSRLSENLLRLASLESEHHPFHPVTFDLDEQLRRVVVSQEPLWSVKDLHIRLNLPKVKMTADADQLNQVWINLLSNAIKFTPGQGTISIDLVPLTDRIQVRIQDSGIGIDKGDLERIFDRFYKVDQARQRDLGGSGLGLAIVRKIIDLHQGSIKVESEPGRGTTFIISFPVLTYSAKRV